MTNPSSTRRFALIGDPVAHSVSPAICAAAFAALGVDATYRTLRTRTAELPETVRSLARGGGGNVTVPHKLEVATLIDEPTHAVRGCGACNCFWGLPGGRVAGDNTDVAAFVDAVEALPGGRLTGADVLLLGAGGGARAVLYGCLERGARRVSILNRSIENARRLVREVAAARPTVSVLQPGPPPGSYDLIVNATSLGLSPNDPLPLELSLVRAAAAFDLVYGPDGTAWTREARRRGLVVADGFEMLVRQAALSIRNWIGHEPPLETMRRAGRAALELHA